MSIITGEYKKAFARLHDMRKLLWAVTFFFFALTLAGFFAFKLLFAQQPELVNEALEQLSQFVESSGVADSEGNLSAAGFFCHNLLAGLQAVAMGFIPLLFLPVISLLVNAFVIGVVAALAEIAKMGLLEFMCALIPHGIFEMPALFICMSIGMSICTHLTKTIFRRKQSMPFLQLIGESARVLVLVAVPLLAAAAVVETYLTPAIMNAVFGGF